MVNYDYLYEKEYFQREIDAKHFASQELSFQTLRNARILPYKTLDDKELFWGGGVVSEDGKYFKSSSISNLHCNSYEYNEELIVSHYDKAIYIGLLCSVWGHCITDGISRFWFLFSDEYKEKYSDYKLVYVPFEDFKFTRNFMELLECFGLAKEDFVSIEEISSVSELILPDKCFWAEQSGLRKYTKEYNQTVERVKVYASKKTHKYDYDKIYLTYNGYHGFRQFGEKYLETFFAEQGYTVIAPEKYTFFEQMDIYMNCKSFATTIGSCSHNAVFLEPGTETILIPRMNFLNDYQQAINEMGELDVVLIDSSYSIFVDQKRPWNGPFFCYVSKRLLSYFGMDENAYCSKAYYKKWWKTFKEYKSYSMSLNSMNTRCCANYMYQEFLDMYQGYVESQTHIWRLVKKVIARGLLYLKRSLVKNSNK